MTSSAARWCSFALVLAAACTADEGEGPPHPAPDADPLYARLLALSPPELPRARPDPTNAWADDRGAAALGHKLFFDPRFSGPLLEDDHDGTPNTLGLQGETGRVSCESCHVATSGFLDTRSARRQISLGSGWTRRRSPSLLDFGQTSVLMWDGRRDTAYNQIFGVIESPLEFNSSRLFVAQQMARFYADEYEAVFGPLPPLDAYEPLGAADAGCAELPEDQVHDRCPKPGHDDDAVIRVVVNMGKAIGAYERLISCGPSRFDAWMGGDAAALTPEEQAGAYVFVKAGCDSCHAGPFLSDQAFHNVGAANVVFNFVEPFDDPGAAAGVPAAHDDRLNARGPFSDGDDGRLDAVAPDDPRLVGAFRTPALRCVSRRPSFMHAGQMRSLEDVISFFNDGGDTHGFQGTKDPLVVPLGLTDDERAELAAFLRALDGSGPDPELLRAPDLPQ
jgi:cytochrome c peroxidase